MPGLRSSLLMTQWIKNPPAVQETQEMWVQTLGQEDSLEMEMVTHSSILAWEVPWTEEPPKGHKELDMTEQLNMHTYPRKVVYITLFVL